MTQLGYAQLSAPAVFINFILDDYSIGEVITYPNEQQVDQSEVDLNSIVKLLEPIVLPEKIQILKNQFKDSKIKLRDLGHLGITTEFDLNNLEVNITIPLSIRKIQDLSLRYKNRSNNRGIFLKPAFASGAFNVLVNKAFNSEEESPSPFNTSLNSFVNINGVVFEDSRSYEADVVPGWKRSESRIVIDQVDEKNRFILGDLRYATTGFQASTPMAGFSFSRELSLDPLSNTTTKNRASFTLNHAATVEIFINGVLNRSLQLKAGRYNLSDLPITTGFNDIDLVITDQLGHKEHLNFPYVYTNELLSPGESRFTYNLGYPSTPKLNDLEYNQKNPLFSGFHRLGLTSKWTSGLYYQKDNNRSLLGIESFVGDWWGNINFDIARSNVPVYGDDFASRLRYRSWNYADFPIRYWGLGLETYGKYFSNYGLTPNNLYFANLDFFINPVLEQLWQTTIGVSHNYARAPDLDSETFYIRASRTLSSNFSINSDASVTTKISQSPDWKIGIYLVWNDLPAKINHIISYNSVDFTKRFELHKGFKADTINLGATDKEQEQNASISYEHTGQRFNFSTDYTANHLKNFSDSSLHRNSQSTNVNLASSLAWTSDTGITLMAPINDSFAIFDLEDGLENETIEMNRSGSESSASSKNWNSLTLSDLVGYQERNVYLESANDLGVKELKENEFVLKPTYKSGIYRKISLLSNFVVRGKVLNENQQPVALQFGEAIPTSKQPSDEHYSFFTNRQGEFEIERLLPGQYKLYFETLESYCAITIPNNANGFYNLDDCKLQRE
jgi:outer membrane usher protein